MEHIELNVNGMSCEHCVNAIHAAVNDLDGIDKVSVELDHKKVVVDYNGKITTVEEIINAIEDQGYDIVK